MSNNLQGGFRSGELIVISSVHHKLAGWNSTFFVDQDAKRNVPNTIIVQVSDYVKSIIGETEKAHIIDLVENSLFKGCPVKIHVFENYGAWKPNGINRKAVFYIEAQPGTFRFNNRRNAYYTAYARLVFSIESYLNPKTITPLDDSEYQLRKSAILARELLD